MPEVLCHCGQQYFVFGVAQTPQSKPVEFENAPHVSKPHLDLLALPAGLLEGFRIGQRTDVLTHLFMKIRDHFAHNCAGALRLPKPYAIARVARRYSPRSGAPHRVAVCRSSFRFAALKQPLLAK